MSLLCGSVAITFHFGFTVLSGGDKHYQVTGLDLGLEGRYQGLRVLVCFTMNCTETPGKLQEIKSFKGNDTGEPGAEGMPSLP